MYIETIDLTKEIKGAVVLDHINLKMHPGKIYGLKGRNGSGKTMLMRALCGFIIPTEGKVIIDGETLGDEISFPRSAGALIESPGFIPGYSGFKNLKTLTDIQGTTTDEKILETLALVGLDPHDKKKFKKYSLGMKQKLGIAAAIVESPQIVILDEPTNALDEKSIEQLRTILQELKEKNTLIIISCHDTEDLKDLSDEIFVIDNGKIKEHIILGEDA